MTFSNASSSAKVDYPWTLVVIDPSGISEMSDMTGVQVITGPEALIEEEAPLLN